MLAERRTVQDGEALPVEDICLDLSRIPQASSKTGLGARRTPKKLHIIAPFPLCEMARVGVIRAPAHDDPAYCVDDVSKLVVNAGSLF